MDHGSLYPALHRLARKGWVTSKWETRDGKREMKYYRLTAPGKKPLAVEESKWSVLVRAIERLVAPAIENYLERRSGASSPRAGQTDAQLARADMGGGKN